MLGPSYKIDIYIYIYMYESLEGHRIQTIGTGDLIEPESVQTAREILIDPDRGPPPTDPY